jgi:hypothetical protein
MKVFALQVRESNDYDTFFVTERLFLHREKADIIVEELNDKHYNYIKQFQQEHHNRPYTREEYDMHEKNWKVVEMEVEE